MRDQIYFDDFEHFDLIVFNSKNGVAVNARDKSVLTFKRIGGVWVGFQFAMSDVSHIECIAVSPEKLITAGGRGLHGAGEGLGSALRNTIHKSRAKGQTGIKLHLRSLDTPSIFLVMPLEQQRNSAFEGLSRILEGHQVSGKMHQLPPHVREELRRPSEQEIRKREARKYALSLSTKAGLAMFGLAVIATTLTLTYLWMQGLLPTGNNIRLRIILGDIAGVTFGLLCIWFTAMYAINSWLRYFRLSRSADRTV